MTVHMDQYFSTLLGMKTHFQSTQTSVAHPTYVLWPTYALKLVMRQVLGIEIENQKYRNFNWYRNRRILIEFPILKTTLWNSYVCNLN